MDELSGQMEHVTTGVKLLHAFIEDLGPFRLGLLFGKCLSATNLGLG